MCRRRSRGDYVAAGNVARIPNVVAFALTALLVPSVARLLARGEREQTAAAITGALRFMLIALLPGAVIIAVNAREILMLLFTPAYGSGAPLLALLVFAQGVGYTVYMTLANVLVATGHARESARLAVAVVVLATALSAVLVLVGGARGAAWASLLATAAASGASVGLLRARLELRLGFGDAARVAALGLIVGSIGWWIETSGIMLIVELVLLSGLTLALLVLAGLVSRADLEPFVPARWRRFSAPPAA